MVGFELENEAIFEEAFTHRSSQQKDDQGNNVNFERLEFLGDSILGGVVSNYLYNQAPNQQEGYLTKMRSKIVSRRSLNEVGKKLGLKELLQHNNPQQNLGEDINGDLVEALVGAIYLDQGYRYTEEFIHRAIIHHVEDYNKLENTISSYKSLILEWSQKKKNTITFNTFEEENAEDLIVFVSIIRLNDKVIAKGRGTSKKKAEENSAKRAYYSLQNQMV